MVHLIEYSLTGPTNIIKYSFNNLFYNISVNFKLAVIKSFLTLILNKEKPSPPTKI